MAATRSYRSATLVGQFFLVFGCAAGLFYSVGRTSAQGDSGSMRQENERLRADLLSAAKAKQELHEQLARAKNEIKSLRKRLADIERERDELRRQLSGESKGSGGSGQPFQAQTKTWNGFKVKLAECRPNDLSNGLTFVLEVTNTREARSFAIAANKGGYSSMAESELIDRSGKRHVARWVNFSGQATPLHAKIVELKNGESTRCEISFKDVPKSLDAVSRIEIATTLRKDDAKLTFSWGE